MSEQPELTVHRGEVFVGAAVTLDGGSWEGCTFTNCRVTATVGATSRLIGCRLDGCDLLGGGWPKPFLIFDAEGVHFVH